MTITEIDGKPCYLNTDWTFYLEELKGLVTMVKKTRQAQKDYFSVRSTPYLAAARRMEELLDREIECYEKRYVLENKLEEQAEETIQQKLNF